MLPLNRHSPQLSQLLNLVYLNIPGPLTRCTNFPELQRYCCCCCLGYWKRESNPRTSSKRPTRRATTVASFLLLLCLFLSWKETGEKKMNPSWKNQFEELASQSMKKMHACKKPTMSQLASWSVAFNLIIKKLHYNNKIKIIRETRKNRLSVLTGARL